MNKNVIWRWPAFREYFSESCLSIIDKLIDEGKWDEAEKLMIAMENKDEECCAMIHRLIEEDGLSVPELVERFKWSVD